MGLLFALLLGGSLLAAQEAPLKAGIARVEITPPVGASDGRLRRAEVACEVQA